MNFNKESFFFNFQGGLKAVVWTDVFQMTIMIIGLCVTIAFGCIEAGGFYKVWEIAHKGNRTDAFK